MPFVIYTTPNPIQAEGGKILTLVKKCRCLIVGKYTYSVYDLVTGVRYLYKRFGLVEGKRSFNEADPFDIFRKLGEFSRDNLGNAEIIAPFVAFVRKPIRPNVLQRVGLGVPYDLMISGNSYIFINGEYKSFGYEVLFDLTEVYKLGRIFLDYVQKEIFVPGTEIFQELYIVGTNIEGYTVSSPIENIWVIPKLQFCTSQATAEVFPFYKKESPAKREDK